MSKIIKALQLGSKDWNVCYQIPENVHMHHAKAVSDIQDTLYDIVFIDGAVSDDMAAFLHRVTKAYTLFWTDGTDMSQAVSYLISCKKGTQLKSDQIPEFLTNQVKNYFSKPYGEKIGIQHIAIAQGFAGSVQWNGHYSLELEGDYGEKLNQIVYWRSNCYIEQGEAMEFWLEYEKDDDVEIALSLTQFVAGSVATVQQEWLFWEQDLQDLVVADNRMPGGRVFVSLQAKGKGRLKIIALHNRHSRRGHGIFLPGGRRYVTEKREEIFYYFEPGDRKPPLNVYFSGYKTRQGFEGYYMMRRMGCPFLLIGEPRLEGGCFYIGDEEYETALPRIIRNCMEDLGFSGEQVIMSGISMGSFGALYYGCDILPHAMIVGKPLLSIGTVASNERLNRPGGFPTSLDVLNYISAGMDKDAIARLNQRFWKKFDKTCWGQSKFILAYMIEDDYENTAYELLSSHIHNDEVQLYGKGMHGRHNDANGNVLSWFKSQYKKILAEDFDRG